MTLIWLALQYVGCRLRILVLQLSPTCTGMCGAFGIPLVFVLQPTTSEPTKESYVAVLCLGLLFSSILALHSCFQHLTHSFLKKISVPQVLTKHIGQGLKTERQVEQQL